MNTCDTVVGSKYVYVCSIFEQKLIKQYKNILINTVVYVNIRIDKNIKDKNVLIHDVAPKMWTGFVSLTRKLVQRGLQSGSN